MSGTAEPDWLMDWDEDDDSSAPAPPEWAALLGYDPNAEPERDRALAGEGATPAEAPGIADVLGADPPLVVKSSRPIPAR